MSTVPKSPYPDGDRSILACPSCGSGEYLWNEDGNRNHFCGQCGQAIATTTSPESSSTMRQERARLLDRRFRL